jgi:outer membrane receptor for ferric coprogen and ferric-rhodotorulic acid
LLLLAALAGVFSGGISHAQNVPSQETSGGVSQSVQNPDSSSASPSASVSSSEEATLPTVTVSAESERETLTEFSGSYTTGATNTTMKLPLTLRETPQTVTVITRQQIDDFGLSNVDEVLKNTSSVTTSKSMLGTGYSSRGFNMQNQYDGMMSSPVAASAGNTWIGSASPDTAFIDHVEIQQGAAGLLVGAGNSGGTINLVRKRPTEAFQAQAEVSLGSWDKRRIVGDISGPLTPSGALRGRAVLLSDDSNSYIDYTFLDKKGFYGVIEALPTDKTKIGLSLQYQKSRLNESASGAPTAPDGSDWGWSRSIFFGTPDGGTRKENMQASLYLEQQLSENWVLKANYLHSIDKTDFHYASFVGAFDANNALRALAVRYHDKISGDTLDMHVQGAGNLFGRRHEFALGLNGSEVESRSDSDISVGPMIDVFHAYHPSMMPSVNTRPAYGDPDKTRQHGIWGVARLNLSDSLKLILGTRVSWYGYWNDSGVQTMEENGVVSPYAGIVYDLNKRLSVYASYSDIFKPQTALDRTGNVLEPIVGANYEVGVKGEFFNKRLNAAAAVFRLEETNRAADDLDFGNPNPVCNGWCSIAQGKIISEGVDLSLNGALTPNWNIGIGYTFVNHEYATGENKGDRADARMPRQLFRVFSTYRIPGSAWTVGGNLHAQSNTFADYGGAVRQSGYALLGLMAKYQITPQAEINITADNVFDRRYLYPKSVQGSHYGEPRRVFASVRVAF